MQDRHLGCDDPVTKLIRVPAEAKSTLPGWGSALKSRIAVAWRGIGCATWHRIRTSPNSVHSVEVTCYNPAMPGMIIKTNALPLEDDTDRPPRDRMSMERAEDRALVRQLIRKDHRFDIDAATRAEWVADLERIRKSGNDKAAADAIKTLGFFEMLNQKDDHLAVKMAYKLSQERDKAETSNSVNITQINIGQHLASMGESERRQWDEARKLLEPGT